MEDWQLWFCTLFVAMAGSKGGIEAGKAYVKGYLDDSSIIRGLKGLRSKFASAARGLLTFGAGVIAGGVAAAGGLFAPIIKAAQMEQVETAFATLLGSVDRAKQALADLREFAAKTPFEFPELADAARSLIAFGVAQEDLIPTLRAVGDVSSAVGAPIGEIAEIYGKARVQGRLFMEDINQLTGRGIPIIQELAKQFGVAESEVRKLVETGQVNFGNLQQAFQDLTGEGGKFAGMMDKQSQTLAGRWSTLKDKIGEALTKIGESLMPFASRFVDAFSRIADNWQGMLEKMRTGWASFVQNVASGVAAMESFWERAQARGAQFFAWADEWRLGGRVRTDLGDALREAEKLHDQQAKRLAEESVLIEQQQKVEQEANKAPPMEPEQPPDPVVGRQIRGQAERVFRQAERQFSSVGTFSGQAAGFLQMSNPLANKMDEQIDVLRDIERNTEEFGIEFN